MATDSGEDEDDKGAFQDARGRSRSHLPLYGENDQEGKHPAYDCGDRPHLPVSTCKGTTIRTGPRRAVYGGVGRCGDQGPEFRTRGSEAGHRKQGHPVWVRKAVRKP